MAFTAGTRDRADEASACDVSCIGPSVGTERRAGDTEPNSTRTGGRHGDSGGIFADSGPCSGEAGDISIEARR